MVGQPQPYMYAPEYRSSSRYPETAFDPKAVTRASWEPKPQKPKQDGPLISFNRHPDAHMVLNYRSNQYTSMSPRTKSWVRGLRRFQLALRVLHFIAAAGLLVLWILFDKVDNITAWVMRVSCGVVMVHAAYAIYHLARDAAGRTPGSSSAYSVFAAVSDLTTLVLYAFGAFTMHQNSDKWITRLDDQALMDYFVPAAYYGTIGAGGLHLLSFAISLWLGVVFRKISMMPPDMNPLEGHLTARPKHKKSKSSVSTFSTTDEKRLSTPLENHRRSGVPYEDISRPPSVPFMHTRTQSRDSNLSARDSQIDLATLRHELAHGLPPRASMASLDSKRMGSPRMSQRGSYTEIPLHETGSPLAESDSRNSSQSRVAKFTETWAPTDSMISRTNQRAQYEALSKAQGQTRQNKSYSALSQRYDLDDSSDSEYDDENIVAGNNPDAPSGLHPNPLRCNPSASDVSAAGSSPNKTTPRMQTPFRPRTRGSVNGPALSGMSANSRRVSASRDIADQSLEPENHWRSSDNGMLYAEEPFYSRPYGDLKSATPPVMIGTNRKVSSGNDFETKHQSGIYERRNVSGKIAEEGRGGKRATHLGFFANGR